MTPPPPTASVARADDLDAALQPAGAVVPRHPAHVGLHHPLGARGLRAQ